jgi:hypothetical protein
LVLWFRDYDATANPDLANVAYPAIFSGAAFFEQKRERDNLTLDL